MQKVHGIGHVFDERLYAIVELEDTARHLLIPPFVTGCVSEVTERFTKSALAGRFISTIEPSHIVCDEVDGTLSFAQYNREI